MGFKENLLKKIEINKTVQKVLATIGPPDSNLKVDKPAMRKLLEIAGYRMMKKRDLELYLAPSSIDPEKILVLDNHLSIYTTTAEDVALRKSPTIKEMVNIRNIIKILNDGDVVASKKEASVKTIQQECIDTLDLTFDASDLAEIEKQGADSLETGYADGVTESLALFAELLGYRPPPKPFRIRHHQLFGALDKSAAGETLYGPMAIYSLVNNRLMLIKEPAGIYDKKKIERIYRVTDEKEDADAEGPAVFQFLKEAVKVG